MASNNNVLNNASSTAVASSSQTFTVSNSDNTGTSSAKVVISVGGGTTTGDPQGNYVITGLQTWSMGVDNSTTDDSFVISNGATLGTTNAHVIQANGFNRWPLQPAYLEILSGNDNNRTGTGVGNYIIGTNVAYTEIFDKGTNFTGTTFTCPNDARVMLIGSIGLTGCTINNGIQIQLVTSNRTYVKTVFRPASANDNVINITALADFDASDTVTMRVVGLGEAGATDDVVGGTTPAITYFCGYMMG